MRDESRSTKLSVEPKRSIAWCVPLYREDGRKVYVLKLLSDDGRVINVRIDAATGRTR
jgi:hypothetical protein